MTDILNKPQYVSSFLIGNILIFSILLYLDMTKKAKSSGGEVIATITYKSKTIQRKFDSQVIWDEVDKDTPLTNRDTIKSGEQSDAVITLKDGTQIQLAENSMILLDFSGKDININFAYGSVQAKRAEGDKTEKTALNIKSGDQTIKLDESSDVKLAKGTDSASALSMVVDKGQATVNIGGKDQVIEKDQKAELGKDKIDIRPITLKPQSPPDQKHIVSMKKSESVSFSWEPVEQNPEVTLEVSQNSSFSKGNVRRNTKSTGVDLNLQAGIYYWRISAKNSRTKSTDYSETRKFSIVSDSPMQLFSPVNKAKTVYVTSIPFINFSWSRNPLASGYKLEISPNRDFSSNVKSYDSTSNSISLESASPGANYWRVTTKPSLPDIPVQQSPVQVFFLENKKVLDPPIPMGPDNYQKISQAFFAKGKALFLWQDNPEFKKFKIQISSDSGFKNIVFSDSSVQNFITVTKPLGAGNYFWRIKESSSEGTETDFSAIRTFSVTENEKLELLNPYDKAEFDYAQGNEGIHLSWKRPEQTGNFLVEISGSKDFQKILDSKTTTGYSVDFNFSRQGEYFWRVKLVEDKAELLISPARSLKILEKISDPVPIFPANNDKIDMSDKDSIKFIWEKIDRAKIYSIEISQNTATGKRMVLKEEIGGSSYTLKDLSKLDEGQFSWTLKAYYLEKGQKKALGNAVKNDFTITLAKKVKEVKPSDIEILSPKTQYVEPDEKPEK